MKKKTFVLSKTEKLILFNYILIDLRSLINLIVFSKKK